MAGERQNGRQVIDSLTERQLRQREREGKPTSPADLERIKERSRETRLRGEERRGQS